LGIQFVKTIGSATSSSSSITTLSITVPAAGVAVGNCIIAMINGFNWATGQNATASDSKSNTYTRDYVLNSTTAGLNVMSSTTVTTALVSGDTITYTFTAGNQDYVVQAHEFSGVSQSSRFFQSATGTTGTSTTPSITITPGANPPSTTLLIANVDTVGTSAMTFTEDTDSTGGDTWHTLPRVNTAQDTNKMTVHMAYKIPTLGNTGIAQTYNPTLGSSVGWIDMLAIYRGIPDVFRLPPRGPNYRR
jgi:hypothetical protein